MSRLTRPASPDLLAAVPGCPQDFRRVGTPHDKLAANFALASVVVFRC